MRQATTYGPDDYRRRDHRVRCAVCHRWMRYSPTDASPARRRPPPSASRCVDCRRPCRHCGARHGTPHRESCLGVYRGRVYEAPDA